MAPHLLTWRGPMKKIFDWKLTPLTIILRAHNIINMKIMKKQGLIIELISIILALAFISAPALDSFACLYCQPGDTTKVQGKDRFQLPHAPSLSHDNKGQRGNNEGDHAPCPYCFLNVFGLIATPPSQTLFPSICFQTPAVPELLSLHPSPLFKPPQA